MTWDIQQVGEAELVDLPGRLKKWIIENNANRVTTPPVSVENSRIRCAFIMQK